MRCIFCNIDFILLYHAALKLTQILITETKLKYIFMSPKLPKVKYNCNTIKIQLHVFDTW